MLLGHFNVHAQRDVVVLAGSRLLDLDAHAFLGNAVAYLNRLGFVSPRHFDGLGTLAPNVCIAVGHGHAHEGLLRGTGRGEQPARLREFGHLAAALPPHARFGGLGCTPAAFQLRGFRVRQAQHAQPHRARGVTCQLNACDLIRLYTVDNPHPGRERFGRRLLRMSQPKAALDYRQSCHHDEPFSFAHDVSAHRLTSVAGRT